MKATDRLWLRLESVKSSMPHSSGNDSLMLDRVIDMPIEQDVLTWDAFEPGRSEGIMLISGLN